MMSSGLVNYKEERAEQHHCRTRRDQNSVKAIAAACGRCSTSALLMTFVYWEFAQLSQLARLHRST
jgi:hypothetical protein